MRSIHSLGLRGSLLMAALCSGCSADSAYSADLAVMYAADMAAALPAAPQLTAVTPASAPNQGGITLTLTGASFVPGATVTTGGVTANLAEVIATTTMTVTLPALPGTVGKVPVVVTNPDGQLISRDDLFAVSASPSTTLPVGQVPLAVAVGDFNGDGSADIAIANNDSSSVSILLGNGLGGFTTLPDLRVAARPTGLTTTDFDSDGKPDLVVVNQGSNSITVLLNPFR